MSGIIDMFGNKSQPKLDNGTQDLGDASKLDIKAILDAEREDVRDCYVLWEKREIISDKGQEYSPIIKVVGIGEVVGRYRVGQHFIDGEREMLTQAISNQLSQLIWGVDMFVEKTTPSGVKFKINPKFRRLPTINPPKNLVDIADSVFESALPLTVHNNDGEEVRMYAVTEITSWDQNTEMPYMLGVSMFDENRQETVQTMYTPADAEPILKVEEPKQQKTENGIPIIGS